MVKSREEPAQMYLSMGSDPMEVTDEYRNRGNRDKTITQNTAGDIVFHNDTSMNKVHVFTSNDVKNMPKILTCILKCKQGFGGLYYQGSFSPKKH